MELEEKATDKYKDSLFVFLFGKEERKDWTLSLYNALNGTNYTDPDELEINTIENIVYIKMHNDVSIMLKAEIWLYEQQSTKCPNMPYRMLEYIHALYQRLLQQRGYNKYDRSMFILPAPHFVVLYNGTENAPEYEEQRLSDMYEDGKHGDLDLLVKVYNINSNNNTKLKQSCKVLNEYMWLVDRIRTKIKNCGRNDYTAIGNAISKALDEMPDDFLIKSLLMNEKEEVLGMIFEEYNEQEAIKAAQKRENQRFEEGKSERSKEIAEKMVKSGFSANQISELTGLSSEEVQKIILAI